MNDNIIRQAISNDLQAIKEIWLEGILDQEEAVNESYLDKAAIERIILSQIDNQTESFKFWVCETGEKEIIGWQSILPFHASPNPLVRNSFGQSSTYIKKSFRENGIGKILLQYALSFCAKHTSIKYVFGLVLSNNEKSVRLCQDVGFYNMGSLPYTTQKDFAKWDIVVYEVG